MLETERKVTLTVDDDAEREIANIGNGVFAPLKGFMTSRDYRGVVDAMRLTTGSPWSIPITLDVPADKIDACSRAGEIVLQSRSGERIAEMRVEEIFTVNRAHDIKKVFGTEDTRHPGVMKEVNRSEHRIGGPLNVLKRTDELFGEYSLTPDDTKRIFREKGWKTIIGFQTRNPIHRAPDSRFLRQLNTRDP